jgi:hypothetical protein
VLERAALDAKPVLNFLRERRISSLRDVKRFVNPLLFQVAYTLMCFKDVGLMHNDLHSGNVFVTLLPRSVERTYMISKRRSVTVRSRVFVQIFDFDFASKHATRYDSCAFRNTTLDTFFCHGKRPICNKYTESYDILRFLPQLTYLCRGSARDYIERRFERVVRNAKSSPLQALVDVLVAEMESATNANVVESKDLVGCGDVACVKKDLYVRPSLRHYAKIDACMKHSKRESIALLSSCRS